MGSSVPVPFGAGISQPRCRALVIWIFFVLKAPLQGEAKPRAQVRDGKMRLERQPQTHPGALVLAVPSVWISFHGWGGRKGA